MDVPFKSEVKMALHKLSLKFDFAVNMIILRQNSKKKYRKVSIIPLEVFDFGISGASIKSTLLNYLFRISWALTGDFQLTLDV